MQLVEQFEEIRKGVSFSYFATEIRSNNKSGHSLDLTEKLTLRNQKIQNVFLDDNFAEVVCGTDCGCVAAWDLTGIEKKMKFLCRPDSSNIMNVKKLTKDEIIATGNSSKFSLLKICEDRILQKSFNNHHTRCVTCSQPVDENVFITISMDRTIHIVDKRQNYSNSETKEIPIISESTLDIPSVASYRKPQYFGGIDNFDPDSDFSSLLKNFKDIPNAELYQIIQLPGTFYQYIIATGRSEAKIFDLRSPSEKYHDLLGYTAISNYLSHKPVTAIGIDDYCDVFSMTINKGKVHLFNVSDSFELSDPFLDSPIDVAELSPIKFVGEDGKFKEEEYLSVKRSSILLKSITNAIRLNLEGFFTNPFPKCDFSFHRQMNFGLQQTAFFGGIVLTGSDTGSIIMYDTDKVQVDGIIKPSNDPVTCISTNKSSFGIAASAGDSVYLYELSHPCETDMKEQNTKAKTMIDQEERDIMQLQPPEVDELTLITAIRDMIQSSI